MEDDYFAILLDGLKDVAHAKVAADGVLGEILNPVCLVDAKSGCQRVSAWRSA